LGSILFIVLFLTRTCPYYADPPSIHCDKYPSLDQVLTSVLHRGHSPGVKFPRVLGIEAVGLVEEPPGGEFKKGDIVATAMGGMGREFDGGYSEFTCVPASQVQAIKSKIR
jgi:hypothetical protein